MAEPKALISAQQKADIMEKIAEQKITIEKLRAVVVASKAAGMDIGEIERAIKQSDTMMAVLQKLVDGT